ncbi:hypothetical protein [Arthrobacter sp. zg-Y1143]|uniref:hypothetical protein n=1 Tax=Arthrobacter sp. zg-Y1143 TaxID=3049065 RepID=UPI0024C2EF0A|nr:hypothetical protein [Arthrobacter sp. zg-Y1143]MDK1328665.1 hypothetical protein [Arthrobacter sp. zg-Y1143]
MPLTPRQRMLRAVLGAVFGSALLAAPAAASPQEADPCARLTAGEVRYDVADAERVTFATAETYGATETRLIGCVRQGDSYVQEWKSWGFSGRNGFAPPGSMWENTLYSPTGSFTITEALGRANPGTQLTYYTLNPASRWGGEHGPSYNQYFEGTGGPADENLWGYMQQGLYEQAAVINWNRPPDMPTRQGASFAIFFHAGYAPTWGCISTDLSTVVRLLKTAVPGDRIVMGTVDDVFTTSTAAADGVASVAARAEEKAEAAQDRAETMTTGAATLAVVAAMAFVIRLAFRSAGRKHRPDGGAGGTRPEKPTEPSTEKPTEKPTERPLPEGPPAEGSAAEESRTGSSVRGTSR